MKPFIYLRALRHVDFSVFAVADGQKKYRDAQFGQVPYASGQQIKRCVMENLVAELGQGLAPVEFRFKLDKDKKAKEDIALQQLDPNYPDMLFGGFMRASNEGGSKEDGIVKRRSPLSISAFRPLHPLLGSLVEETAGTFDRTSSATSSVTLMDSSGNILTPEQMLAYLNESNAKLRKMKFLNPGSRANGLFVYDIAIDLRRLFTVSSDRTDPELPKNIQDKLVDSGWKEVKNAFGPALLTPENLRKEWAPALANALLNWEFGSNQARTYHPKEILAVAISQDANNIVNAIRGELLPSEETTRQRAIPRLDTTAGAELYIAPAASGYIQDVSGDSQAIGKAKERLIELINSFSYENQ